MSLEEFLVSELSKINEIKDKIYPLTGEENIVAPYLIYTSSEGVEDKTLTGYLQSKEVNIEIDVMNDKYSSMKALTKKVIVSMKSLLNKSFDNYYIENITYEDPIELYEKEVFLYRSNINFRIKLGGN